MVSKDTDGMVIQENNISIQRKYYIYIFTNRLKTDWSIGITSDLKRKVEKVYTSVHKWNYFFKWFGCVHLVYYEVFYDIRDAIDTEHRIKSWDTVQKKAFIRDEGKCFRDFKTSFETL